MRINLSIIFLSLWSIGFAQLDWGIYDVFKGPVKSVITHNYHPGNSTRGGDTVADYNYIETKIILFDKEKKPLMHLLLYAAGDTTAHCTWEYDGKGRKIKQTDYRENNRLEQTIKITYKGNLTVRKCFLSDGKLYTTEEFTNDSDDFLIRRKEFFKDEKKYYAYYLTLLNIAYLPIKEYEIDSAGKETPHKDLYYDKYNRIISANYWWNPDSASCSREEFRYDRKGYMIEIKRLDRRGHLLKLIHQQYNENGNVILILTYSPGDAATSIDRIGYIYDSFGNWTSKKIYYEYDDGREYEGSKVIREIVYY